MGIEVPPFVEGHIALTRAMPPNGKEGPIRCKRLNPGGIRRVAEDRDERLEVALFGSGVCRFQSKRLAIFTPSLAGEQIPSRSARPASGRGAKFDGSYT